MLKTVDIKIWTGLVVLNSLSNLLNDDCYATGHAVYIPFDVLAGRK